MKQSKGFEDGWKLLQKAITEAEERGAAREREKFSMAVNRAAEDLKAVAERLLVFSLKQDAMASAPKPQPKKRKAVEASEDCVAGVREVFEKYPNSIILPKNLNIGFGLKNASAACRSLVESHVLEKVGTKGYRLAQKENGLDETALPSR